MIWTETDITVLVLVLGIITERVAPRFGRLLIKPAAGKDSTSGFDPHHRRASTAVLDRRSTFEAFACLRRGLDFGPPPGCDDGPQPHNRMPVSVTALSTTVVPSGAMLARFDAEHFQFSDYTASDLRAVAYDKL
jgi:hypothetical protein